MSKMSVTFRGFEIVSRFVGVGLLVVGLAVMRRADERVKSGVAEARAIMAEARAATDAADEARAAVRSVLTEARTGLTALDRISSRLGDRPARPTFDAPR
jgi:hypothetical protein